MMKQYACIFCKVWTDRKSARKCIMTHIRPDKDFRAKKREGSNITEKLLREEI